MLPLRYLADDRTLALRLLDHWQHDEEHLSETMDRYRISANAVYPFPCGGKIQFLRFAPCSEKGENNWKAEIAFLTWLREQGYPCPRAIPSLEGHLIEEIPTPGGQYLAVVFERAPGRPMDTLEPTEALIRAMGASLGHLHKLSAAYKPLDKPWGFDDILGWCSQELRKLPDTEGAQWEAVQLQSLLDDASRPKNGFGVLHHDFEPDNLFVAEDGSVSVIDFEDCCMGWFANDLDIAVTSLEDWLHEQKSGISVVDARMAFLNGYRTEYSTPGHLWALLPMFQRLERLYKYTRLSRALAGKGKDEPDWMVPIRHKLEDKVAELAIPYQVEAAMPRESEFEAEEPEEDE